MGYHKLKTKHYVRNVLWSDAGNYESLMLLYTLYTKKIIVACRMQGLNNVLLPTLFVVVKNFDSNQV